MSIYSLFALFATFASLTSLTLTNAYFPEGSCGAQPCAWSPYDFAWSSIDNNGTFGKFCFNVIPRASGICDGPCCTKFETLFMKFVVKSSPVCNKHINQVSINGIKKGGGVFFDLYDVNDTSAQLRVTSMSYNNVTVQNATFCIVTTPPCNDIATFCDGPCMYSIYDPYAHTCCPTCLFYDEGHMPLFPGIPLLKPPPSPSPSTLPPSPPYEPYPPDYTAQPNTPLPPKPKPSPMPSPSPPKPKQPPPPPPLPPFPVNSPPVLFLKP